MQCKHCGKQLEEGWVVCPFCRTAVSEEGRAEEVRQKEGRTEETWPEDVRKRQAECYEVYESLSPLPPAVRQAYEESRRKEREEEATRRSEETGAEAADRKQEETGIEAADGKQEETALRESVESRSFDRPVRRTRRRNVLQEPAENPEKAPEKRREPPNAVVTPETAAFQGTKALRTFAAAGSLAAVLPLLFCAVFAIPLCADFISEMGVIGALVDAGEDFALYLSHIAVAVGVGSVLGVLAAYARLRRIPVLCEVLAAGMSFVRRIPFLFWLMLLVTALGTMGYVVVSAALGLLGAASLGNLFYINEKRAFYESGGPVSVRAFAQFLWQRGVPGFGREVRQLYHGGLMMGLVTVLGRNAASRLWNFTMVRSQMAMNYSAFYLLLMIVSDFLIGGLARRLWKKLRQRRDRGCR